jgi:hypothetical protein
MRRTLMLLVVLSACGPHAMTPDAGDVGCVNRTGIDTYSAGMQHKAMSGKVTATLLAADPAPPQRGTNTWSVKLTDESGAPLTGTPVATPYMPEHGHGTSVVPAMQKQPDGSYQVTPLYLFMPGLWRVSFAAQAADPLTDQAQFLFCIDG